MTRATHILRQFTAMKSTVQQTEKELSIKAPWGNIAGLSWGDPKNPPVMLFHGKLDVCSGFRPLVSRLPNCFYYISIDIPGNGRSDHLPKGIRYTIMDLVPTVTKVMQHFNYDKFMYIAHSLGVSIGKFFNIAYPGRITRMVELDPIPAYLTWPLTDQGLSEWYHYYYKMYNEDKYLKYNGDDTSAPKYSYEKAQQMMKARGLSKEGAEHVLERCLVPAGDGLYRLTFDQRMKEVTAMPFSGEALRQLYTSTSTPILCFLSKKILDAKLYDSVPFVRDEKLWPHNNYRYKIVDGGHDVHIDNPGCMAEDISQFLLEDFNSKY